MDVQRLRELCEELVNDPSLEPVKDHLGRIIETHCNEGAERSANEAGCHELDGLMADQQYAVMNDNRSGRWAKVDGETASLHAQGHPGGDFGACPPECKNTCLAFAALPSYRLGELHGHITTVAPEPCEFSPSLGELVPVVANVGGVDAEDKESRFFPVAKGEPDHFVWLG